MKTWIFVRFFFRQSPFQMSLAIVLLALASALEAVMLLSLVPVLDFLVKPDLQAASRVTQSVASLLEMLGLPVTLMSFLGVFWFLTALTSVTGVAANVFLVRAKFVIYRDLLLEAPRDFFAARWRFFSSHSHGKLFNTLSQEIVNAADAFFVVVMLFVDIVSIVASMAIPLYLSWKVTSLSMLAAGVIVLPFLFLSGVSYRMGKTRIVTGSQLTSVMHELLSLAKLIIGFGNQARSLERLSQSWEAHRQAMTRFQLLSHCIPFAYRTVSLVVLGLTLLASSYFGVALSETAIILVSLYQTLPRLGRLAANHAQLENYYAGYEQIQQLRDEAKSLEQRSGTKVFNDFEDCLELEQLEFNYPDCPPLLSNINLRILRGSLVALVGKSGVGKSTLIDLIMGFHEPCGGVIRFDGTPLQEFDVNSYRQRIGYVPQNSVLFNLSIRENLLWANDSATDADIRNACAQANATEFIEQLPDRYETVVGDRGTRLSGGQVQRLALARAILRKPALLILDEATSSLDSYSEHLIQQAIESIAHSTTVIVIAHRLSTIMNADQIVMLQDGQVIEQDTYQTLMGRDGCFSRMVRAQELELRT